MEAIDGGLILVKPPPRLSFDVMTDELTVNLPAHQEQLAGRPFLQPKN